MLFTDRTHAGAQLAAAMDDYHGRADAIVLALPRGGVVVGAAVAHALQLPLDIVVTRKIGAPGQKELAIGAIDENGNRFLDEQAIALLDVSDTYIVDTIEKEKKEAARRLSLYRRGRPPLDLSQKTAILVDDGIATGATMRAAIASCRAKGAVRVVVAVPVVARDTLARLRAKADQVIALHAPAGFGAVGQFYDSFDQTTDEEVARLLRAYGGHIAS